MQGWPNFKLGRSTWNHILSRNELHKDKEQGMLIILLQTAKQQNNVWCWNTVCTCVSIHIYVNKEKIASENSDYYLSISQIRLSLF